MNSTSLSRLSARFPARFSARLAVAALGVSAIALTGAATAQDGGAAGGLILPDNPAFFAKNDPNHRKATVIVNGEMVAEYHPWYGSAALMATAGLHERMVPPPPAKAD